MRILVIGVAFSDIKGFPFGAFDPKGTSKGSVTVTHGGVARNVAEDMANLGADVAFETLLDDTPISRSIAEKLTGLGVDISGAVCVQKNGVGMWLAVFDENGELAGSISQMPDVEPLEKRLDAEGDALFSDADAVVAEYDTSERIAEKACALAKKHGKPLYAIVGNMSVILARPELMARTRCAIMNHFEAGKMFGCALDGLSPDDALTLIWAAGKSMGLPGVIVTLGPKGCVWADFIKGTCGAVPPKRCRVADTTGAGDAFFSAAVMSLTRGDELKRACEIGTELAGRVIESTESACPRECRDIFD